MIDKAFKKYMAKQSNKDRKMIKKARKFKLKFEKVSTPKKIRPCPQKIRH